MNKKNKILRVIIQIGLAVWFLIPSKSPFPSSAIKHVLNFPEL